VTVIDSEGKVIADSEKDPASMENHKDRPEFQEALLTGSGHAIRDSDTLGTLMVYAASRMVDAEGKTRSVVRVARSDAKVDALSRSITRTFWLAAGVSIIVGLLACYLFIEIRIGGTERVRRGPAA
jgi:two-component system phosphate regulon sensor histidine kinase PhoR